MNDEYKWGDDPGEAIVKAAGSPLALQIESDVIAGYLLILRALVEKDEELSDRIAKSKPARLAKPYLVEACEFVKLGTEYLLDRAAGILLDELEEQRKNPSLYLVSCKTGRAVMPITAKNVYTPPDYEDLDGNLRPAKPVVHPGITSSLAIVAHETAKQESLVALAGRELAFVHLSAPEQMVEMAKQKLTGDVIFGNVDGPWQEIEFGKENAAGMEQSVNAAFHRVELFSAILAKRILTLCGRGGRCQAGSVSSHRGAKQSWYALSVKCERFDAASTGKHLGQD